MNVNPTQLSVRQPFPVLISIPTQPYGSFSYSPWIFSVSLVLPIPFHQPSLQSLSLSLPNPFSVSQEGYRGLLPTRTSNGDDDEDCIMRRLALSQCTAENEKVERQKDMEIYRLSSIRDFLRSIIFNCIQLVVSASKSLAEKPNYRVSNGQCYNFDCVFLGQS